MIALRDIRSGSTVIALIVSASISAGGIDIARRVSLRAAEGVRVTWRVIEVPPDSTIHELLLSQGILPDVEAFAVVYELNPQLNQLSRLTPGTTLMLPVIDSPATIESGKRIAIVLDADLKESITGRVYQLRKILPRIRTLQNGLLDTAVSLDDAVDTLEFMQLGFVRRNGRPISREALEQLDADAALLNAALSRANDRGRWERESSDALSAVLNDIRIKKRAFTQIASGKPPDRWPEVRVIVRTLKGGIPVSNLRVYYVPQALRGNSAAIRTFDRLSTPSDRSLPEADYFVWASRDPAMTPITSEYPLIVRSSSSDIIVDLTVLE